MKGAIELGLAAKPTLHQYFFFRVKSKNKMYRNAINEAEGLWESLYKIYKLQGKILDIEKSLDNLIQDGIADFSLKHLGSIKNADGTISAQQLFFNEVLIFIFTFSNPEGFETDDPESVWESQLDITESARDLKKVLGLSSILQTASNNFNEVLMKVRINLTFAKEQAIHYSTFDFGQFIRFGDENNYLFVLHPHLTEQQNEQVDKFITNNFPYLLTLNLIVNENYKLLTKLQKKLRNIETQIVQQSQGLAALRNKKDTIMLAIRRDHMEGLQKDAENIEMKIRKHAEKLNLYLVKFKTTVKNIDMMKDEIFIGDIKKFKGYNDNIQEWYKTSDEIFNRTFSMLEDYCKEIENIIEGVVSSAEVAVEGLGELTRYAPMAGESAAFSIEESPYKTISEKIDTSSVDKKEIIESIPLEWGSNYYLIDDRSAPGLDLFKSLVTGKDPFFGLCITNDDRKALIKKYNLKDATVYQVKTELDDDCIPPVLSVMSHLINEFLTNNIHRVIYLSGFDYLIEYNDFKRVLKFINNIKESIVLNDSILIISIVDSSLNEDEFKSFTESSINITGLKVVSDDLF